MFDLTEYREKLETIRIMNHFTRIEIAREIGIAYHTYLKAMVDDNGQVSPFTLKKLKKFLDKYKD